MNGSSQRHRQGSIEIKSEGKGAEIQDTRGGRSAPGVLMKGQPLSRHRLRHGEGRVAFFEGVGGIIKMR